jgi:hypothetical protein
MSSKSYCPVCGKKSETNECGLNCTGYCEDWFHRSCIKISKTEYEKLARDARNRWECGRDDCETRGSLKKQSKQIKGMLDELKSEFANKLDTMMTGYNQIKTKLDEVVRENLDLRKAMKFSDETYEVIVADIKELKEDIKKAAAITITKDDVEDLNQYQRRNNLEIHGVPEDGQNVYDTVFSLCNALEVPLEEKDIDVAHRLPTRKEDMEKPILVRFVNRWKKEEILMAKKRKPSLTSSDIGIRKPARRIYINEHLTAYYKMLHKKARDLRPNVKYVWVKDCKVYARKTDDSMAIWVKNENDIQNLRRQ